MDNTDFELPMPRVSPPLDAGFRPAALARRRFAAEVQSTGQAVPVLFALEQSESAVFHFATEIFPEKHPAAAANFAHLERLLKFLLWSRGACRIHIAGPKDLTARLQAHFRETDSGQFDSDLVGRRVYGRAIEVVQVAPGEIPPQRLCTRPLGGHLEGCRIGFDIGGSDRKVAAVQDGKVLFSEEVPWDPYHQADPQYHYDGIMSSLKSAAAHLPRVDAIGGSAAGVYVNNCVRVASLFRSVPAHLFSSRVERLFFEIQSAWNGVPFEVVNDGEVTALAGSMALGRNAVLGLALGTSLAAGYINREGNISSWLNELAFAPIDYRREAPRDEWSGDRGLGVQYLSQQAVGRMVAPAEVPMDRTLPLPEQLKHVQQLMAEGDKRAGNIFDTIGVYLGYALAHYADFYDFDCVLVLGRVMSGEGGSRIIDGAKHVLRTEFRDLAERLIFHVPDEREKRHGQAVAAASLPAIQFKAT